MKKTSLKEIILSAIFAMDFSFKGRISRRDFWCCVVMLALALAVLGFLFQVALGSAFEKFIGVVFGFLTLFVVFQAFSLSWKRLHDIGKSGAFTLLFFVPFGLIALLVFWCLDSQLGSNRYGPYPEPNPWQ